MDSDVTYDMDVSYLRCDICRKKRPESDIDTAPHDFSSRFKMKDDTFVFSCRHCADNDKCVSKARDREFILNTFIGK